MLLASKYKGIAMNVNFNNLGVTLAARLIEKNEKPKSKSALFHVITKHCTCTNGIFLNEYYKNVKTFDESMEFRSKILAVAWHLLWMHGLLKKQNNEK